MLVAAALGLTIQPPLSWLAHRDAIDVLLAVLVFATGLTIDPVELCDVPKAWPRVAGAVVAGLAVLPVLSFAASHLVAAGPLRDGVETAGLAPCEIASVATTAIAGGAAAVSAGVLIGSTVATVALAGPILTLEASHAHVAPGGIVANLALVVALPLIAGLLVRALVPRSTVAEPAASTTAVIAVAALVAVIASQVHLTHAYLAVAAALLVFLVASAVLGRLLGIGSPQATGRAVLLTTSMRDFAVAAGLATTAFGPAAAAPLGLYGVFVLVWGTGAAGVLRQRPA